MPILTPQPIPDAVAGSRYRLSIQISDTSGIDQSTVTESAFAVTDPNSAPVAKTLTLQVNAGGLLAQLEFDTAIAGNYEISALPNQIRDAVGNAIATTEVVGPVTAA